ncbi:hypothetical protein CC80DRAFT_551524 [Byssothecium circinans]|uniref:Uncharacterized protein n=1 Tax=Byssothecium circinans TaxID=147558 RepID=A0A6A5TLQ9_9PLEO|nr:hypothetical protein CC80DRAFT_551524 [Byssothecium circinans]
MSQRLNLKKDESGTYRTKDNERVAKSKAFVRSKPSKKPKADQKKTTKDERGVDPSRARQGTPAVSVGGTLAVNRQDTGSMYPRYYDNTPYTPFHNTAARLAATQWVGGQERSFYANPPPPTWTAYPPSDGYMQPMLPSMYRTQGESNHAFDSGQQSMYMTQVEDGFGQLDLNENAMSGQFSSFQQPPQEDSQPAYHYPEPVDAGVRAAAVTPPQYNDEQSTPPTQAFTQQQQTAHSKPDTRSSRKTRKKRDLGTEERMDRERRRIQAKGHEIFYEDDEYALTKRQTRKFQKWAHDVSKKTPHRPRDPNAQRQASPAQSTGGESWVSVAPSEAVSNTGNHGKTRYARSKKKRQTSPELFDRSRRSGPNGSRSDRRRRYTSPYE